MLYIVHVNPVMHKLCAVMSFKESYEFIAKNKYFNQLNVSGYRQVNIFQTNKGTEACATLYLSCTLSSFLCSYTFFQIVPFHFKSSFVHFVVNIFSFLIGC